ncbi:MAG: hypothetical protein JNG89_04795, partial [Planctomycetaceae bacterium]|nr:hypothetical protein [Planctomycetaceae bacterium]
MTPSIRCHRAFLTGMAVRTAGCAAALLGMIGLSGCVIPNSSAEPSGPPAAWVQRSNPINPAPLEFEQRTAAVPPILELQTNGQTTPGVVPIELTPPLDLGPQVPAPQPEPPALPAFPPLAPGVEPVVPVPAPEPAVTQAMIDECSAQIRILTVRVEEQAAALNEARAESEAARVATQRLQSDFITWRAELDIVRETIQAQSAADLQALDELNQTLEQLLNVPETPA